MSNLLKSKFFLGFMVVAIMFAGVVAVSANKAAADTCTVTKTLKVGSKGAEVKCLQATLGLTADGSFGPKTKASVIAWQKSKGLVGDGVFGAKSRAAFVGGTVVVGTTPGCENGAKYNANTGALCTGVIVNPTGPVSVSLSSDTPAAQYVIQGQAGADLAHFMFTGSGVVNSMTLQRTGVSDSNTLSNVYLYDGATRLTSGYSFNTNGTIVMNNLGIVVNGSKVIAVKADVATPNTASTIGVALTSYTAGATATMATVRGNEMTIGTATLAGANFPSATVSPAAATINAGSMNQNLWSRSLTVSQHAVKLHSMTVKMVGSAPTNALSNVALYVDGVNVASSSINSASQYVFVLATPLSLSTGSHLVEVHGDIVGGADRNFYLSLEQSTDLAVEDSQMSGVYISVTSAGAVGVNVNGGLISVAKGSLTINQNPAFNNTTTLVGGSTNTTLASFKVSSYGEDVKITSLSFTPTISLASAVTALASQSAAGATTVNVTNVGSGYLATPAVTVTLGTCTGASAAATATMTNGTVTGVTTSGITCTAGQTFTVAIASPATTSPTLTLANVGLYVNGGQVGSSQTATSGSPINFTSLGSQLLVTGGTPSIVEIKGDIMTSGNVNYTAGTIVFALNAGSSNAQGMSSSQLTSTSAAGGQSLSINSTNVQFAATTGFAASTVAPSTTAKIGSFTVQTGSSEGITINTIAVNVPGTLVDGNQLTNLTIKDDSGAVIGTPIGNPVSSGNTFSVTVPVAASSTKVLSLYADLGSTAGLNVTPAMGITYRGVISNLSTTVAPLNGVAVSDAVATIADTTGTTLVSSSSPASQYVIGGSTIGNLATFNIKTSNSIGGAVIKDMTFTSSGSPVSQGIASVTVNGKTASFVSGTATVYNVGLVVPADASGINFPVGVTLICANSSSGCPTNASGSTVILTLTSYTFNNGSTVATVTPDGTSVHAAPTHMLVVSKPTLTVATPSSTVLTTGLVEAIDVTVQADAAGTIKLNSFPISSTLSGSGAQAFDTTAIVVKDANNTTIDSTGSGTCAGGAGVACAITVVLANGYTLNAGQSQTFKVFLPVAALSASGTLPNTYMYTHLVSGSTAFSWTDVAGGATVTNTTYAIGYPSTVTSSIHN